MSGEEEKLALLFLMLPTSDAAMPEFWKMGIEKPCYHTLSKNQLNDAPRHLAVGTLLISRMTSYVGFGDRGSMPTITRYLNYTTTEQLK
jgi:hypothetical protein